MTDFFRIGADGSPVHVPHVDRPFKGGEAMTTAEHPQRDHFEFERRDLETSYFVYVEGVQIGRVVSRAEREFWGTVSPELGVVPTTIGPVTTERDLVARMLINFREQRSVRVPPVVAQMVPTETPEESVERARRHSPTNVDRVQSVFAKIRAGDMKR